MSGGGGGGGSTLETTSSGTKMKRSPRFSSFDSQASLAGAAAEATAEDEAAAKGRAGFSGFRLHPETGFAFTFKVLVLTNC